MPSVLGNTVPDPRIRPPRAKQAPIPADQRSVQQQRTVDRQDEVNAEIEAFQAEVNTRCASMAERFGFSERHCKDLLLAAGVRTIFARPGGNSFNSFLSIKAKERQESMCYCPSPMYAAH